MRYYIVDTLGFDFIKGFNVFMVGWLLGIILGFVATNIDQYNNIKKGYVYNLFLGEVKVVNDRNKEED